MPRPRGKQRQLSRAEVVGAWLRLWTPPRDVEVPPVPWRGLAVGAAALVVLAFVVALVGIPAVEEHNRDTASREQAADDARLRARLRRLAAEQAPHTARTVPSTSLAARRALVEELERLVGDDARARVAAGKLRGPIARVDCVAAPRSRVDGVPPERDPHRRRGGYDCTAVTSDIKGTTGSLGYPFRGVLDFRAGRLTWCKTNPPPGEQVVPDPSKVAPLPAECRDPGAG